MEPFVTLWHWTNPLWLEKAGGCESRKFAFYFARYSEFVVKKLEAHVQFWITLNEPTSVIANAYWRGLWPPEKKSLMAANRVFNNFAKAHKQAYESIHSISTQARVGFAHILQSFEPYSQNYWPDKLSVSLGTYFINKRMLILTSGYNDFLSRPILFP